MNTQNGKKGMMIEAYLDKDIQVMMDDMTHSEMNQLFSELSNTRYWIAIMKYNKDRLHIAQNALFTLDPFKDQTNMARYQGIMSGMLDLPEAILTCKEKAEASQEKNTDN